MDPEIKDIIKELKANIENKEEIRNIFKRSGVAEKIGKAAEGAGLAYTVFLVGKHLWHGDAQGLNYDALNLWIMPKLGQKISTQVLKLGERLNSPALKGFAPILGRAIGNFAAFLGLAEAIKVRGEATDLIDIKMADLSIATNSIFIAADVPAMAANIMSTAGVAGAAEAAEFFGPIGMGVGIAAIIISDFIQAELQLEKLEEHISLTGREENEFYWDFFLANKIPGYIYSDMEAKGIYSQYIRSVIDRFAKDYDVIAMTLPPMIVQKDRFFNCTRTEKCHEGLLNECSILPSWSIQEEISQITHVTNITATITNLWIDCIGRAMKSEAMLSGNDPNNPDTRIIPISGDINCLNNRIVPGNVIPQNFSSYDDHYFATCGPIKIDILAQFINQTDHDVPNPGVYADCDTYDGPRLRSRKIEKLFFEKYRSGCDNAVIYRRNKLSKQRKHLYYITSDDVTISPIGNSEPYPDYTRLDSTDIIFYGKSIVYVVDPIQHYDPTINRYYFENSLEYCSVIQHNSTNFFYTKEGQLPCVLGNDEQKNVIVIQNNFTQQPLVNVHSIIGNNETNYIDVSNIGYIDGKGGNDVITAKGNSTAIKGYMGDTIYGKGLVLLPLNFSDIANITYANDTTAIYNADNESISINRQAQIKTADNLFITPTRVDDKTNIVTNLQVVRSVDHAASDDEISTFIEINNPNFNITKQFISKDYHIIISDSGHHIFYPDEDYRKFYWAAPDDVKHLYLFDKRNAHIAISDANGILDFSQLNSTLDDISLLHNDKGEVNFNKDDLHVTLLPGYKDITVTFDGKEYYKLQNGELKRDYCSHGLKIDGKFSINGTDLLNHHNCFIFDSNKVLFLKQSNDLALLSEKGALSISDYYSFVHRNWDLSIKLNNRIIEPKEFGTRADNPSSLRYYSPNEQGLQIYHNQPVNKNDIGLIDLKDQSILDGDMKVVNGSLVLSYSNNTIVTVENWNAYQPAREMIFAFNDTIVSNSKCVISTCNPRGILQEFQQEKNRINAKMSVREQEYNSNQSSP